LKAGGHRWTVSESARACAGVERGREEQIQALDRTQPACDEKAAAPHTHDYKRNGTTTLFAALDTATGEVTGYASNDIAIRKAPLPAHDRSDRSGRGSKSILICDNYATQNMNGCNAGWRT